MHFPDPTTTIHLPVAPAYRSTIALTATLDEAGYSGPFRVLATQEGLTLVCSLGMMEYLGPIAIAWALKQHRQAVEDVIARAAPADTECREYDWTTG